MIVVTGATGQLGHHAIEGLLAKLPAEQIVAAVRDPGRAEEFARCGVQVRVADYNQPATLRTAFAGADRILLISSNDYLNSATQHAAAVEAAANAGVERLVYTSFARADSSRLKVVIPHLATERVIRNSGLPFTILRNNPYSDLYVPFMMQALMTGTFVSSAGEGRVAGATRADYAAAAVAVVTGTGHHNRVYELTGDTAWSFAEMTAELSNAAGKDIAFNSIEPDQHREILTALGLPPAVADVFVDTTVGIAAGELSETTSELRDLINRPTTTLAQLTTRVVNEFTASNPSN